MSIEEARISLRRQLEEQFGVMESSILLDRPPGGWSDLATNQALDALKVGIDRRFDEIDRRFDQVDRRFDEIDHKFDSLEAGIDLRVTSAVNRAVASQTRWLFGAIIAVIPILAVINRL